MPKILLVDSDSLVREALVHHMPHHLITTFQDPELALQELDGNGYQIGILDLNASGWELLRIIKDVDNGWDELSVIITSHGHEPESALKAWNLGASYFVTKPYGLSQMGRVIKHALEIN